VEDGRRVGVPEGPNVGIVVGATLGIDPTGCFDGFWDGTLEGELDGMAVGTVVGRNESLQSKGGQITIDTCSNGAVASIIIHVEMEDMSSVYDVTK